jgi:Holliday junction resolvase RusA-like endonuclease
VIELSFTAPPSTNNLYASVRGKRVRTGRYKTWQQVAGWEVVAAYPDKQHIDGPFCLSIWLPPGLDLDNGVKAIADLLGPGKHGLGITEDDRQMVELHVYRDRTTKGTCRVRIEARQ